MNSIDSWNRIFDFHDRACKEYDSGREGVKAIHYLHSVMGHDRTEDEKIPHPLMSRLVMASESNYAWLFHSVRRLQILRDLKGRRALSSGWPFH